ncbi:MAG: hypothetical protein QF386_05180 [Alphaproteobacteria bacterium]|nr:hypothetical protein [Alphaproteobacteria bacterium]MDP6661076.1 hypothetical protein [Alphaproteobacteria bacterium]MDP6781330.1 hypothetical protein [Alphaproteobacteria bacterium]MDP7045001.1 hypothetical protein [Alphaproteobacteria bacterium]
MPRDNKKQNMAALATQARRMIRAADRTSLATVLREQMEADGDAGLGVVWTDVRLVWETLRVVFRAEGL